jgi:hypothetical protein
MLEPIPSPTLDLLKVIGSFAGGATGAVSGALLKQWFDQRALLAIQKQTRWLPLLEATREFKTRLEELIRKYPSHPARNRSEMTSLACDFWELYTLDKERKPFDELENPELDGILDTSRDKESDVQRVSRRMCHQLNYAASSLYITAKYLACAERVRTDLKEGRLRIAQGVTERKLTKLISDVRKQLNGVSKEHPGSGIIFEQQESIAESVCGADNRIISYFEFRQRLLTKADWDQFTGLFRFFVHFDQKISTEVRQTIEVLDPLCEELERIYGRGVSRAAWFRMLYTSIPLRLPRLLRSQRSPALSEVGDI